MGKRLGHMIREFREKQGRTIEEAARGLLSAAELSRVENGTKEIEYLIMEALFETYGKSLDKLEIVVSSDEYRILELRDRIYEALLQKRSADAEELIRQYKDITDEELDKVDDAIIARYCEHLIRSGVNSPYILEKYLGKANLSYVDKNNNNLLVIAILSRNFRKNSAVSVAAA